MSAPDTEPPRHRVRPGDILRVRAVWVAPLVIASVVIAIMSALYFGSVVNPTAHLHGLPVMVVNQDAGGAGAQVVQALRGSEQVTDRLDLRVVTLERARAEMDGADAYAALVIPATFSRGGAPLTLEQNL